MTNEQRQRAIVASGTRLAQVCRVKVWYETSREARREAKRLGRFTGKKLMSYHCQTCGRYHLTSGQRKALPSSVVEVSKVVRETIELKGWEVG